MKKILYFIIPALILSCGGSSESEFDDTEECLDCEEDLFRDGEETFLGEKIVSSTCLIVLGTCQDAGSPQINCQKDCCRDLHMDEFSERRVVSLGLVDSENQKKYIFEATPDFPSQIAQLQRMCIYGEDDVPDGIFLTHAHIGHYTGLMYLGKEAMSADSVPVFAMPLMKIFLEQNGPWSQLVTNQNIDIHKMRNSDEVVLSDQLIVTPFLVPHRDEYSETVGFDIKGPNKTALFIPDIDKWEKWDKDIIPLIKRRDYAFIDATFYDGDELPNRDMSEVPHPFVEESMKLFEHFSEYEKSKIIFIHFNHTNPLLDPDSEESQYVLDQGYKIARKGDVYPL